MKQIERTIHDSAIKAIRTWLIKNKGSDTIYLYSLKYQRGTKLHKREDFNRWVAETNGGLEQFIKMLREAETTKEIKVKGGKQNV
jgi:hypothetical protein